MSRIRSLDAAAGFVSGRLSRGRGLAQVIRRTWDLEEPEDMLTGFITARLSANEGSALVVENQLDQKGDPVGPGRLPGRKGYLGKEIYSFLPAVEADAAVVKETLVATFCSHFNLLILTSPAFSSRIPADEEELEESSLEEAATCATTLIMGAYHEEAHLVWERPRPAPAAS